ncbi:MAG TPA: PVC-type heme-binding CxxCH protein [Planctomycetaceae bacterium]|nr:PVC-type heme-binding CxxCH protein [Planctomycetaceae bacterium]
MRRLCLTVCFLSALVTSALAADPRPLFDSKIVSPGTPNQAVKIDIDIAGAKELYLVVRDAGDSFGCDWADWIEPRLVGPNGEKKLTDLKWKSAAAGYGEVRINANAGGKPLRVNGRDVANGIGTHANSVIAFDLPAGYTKFQAMAGLDSSGTEQGCGSTVQFLVFAEKPPANIAAPSNAPVAASRDAAEAVAGLDVAPGLEATLFAAEPLLKNPSNIDIDHLGRIWVGEVMNYRRFANKDNPDRPEGDRILVLEDTNGDSVADKQTVFYQGKDIDSVHGICVLGDRVIVSAGDSVFSLYDKNGDLKADDGSKELLFTGISGTQHDHGIHAFVFGPDGKLYFNFGNSGKQLKDKNGQPIVDKAGNEINDSRKPYQEGMVFRCNLDGSEVETLGWNFRNNWEVCVDSFGTMWQSDNDDDGNRGVRINFVMEFGNYGYKDELTGAGWRDPRTNLEEEIPLRHWHLNDPGVVPNLLQTGAGSPTGICIYEGDLLPEVFRNQIIHCDAGPNIVRAYPVKEDGAGYKAEMVNILEGTRDKWFRPSDVCVAPDGSLIVADWYDPGVGGHRQGDVDRGRLFRVAPPKVKYTVPKTDFTTVDGAITALKSPNHATRYLAWTALNKMGESAEAALTKVFMNDTNPRFRARAFWLINNISTQSAQTLVMGTLKPNQGTPQDFRVMALRAMSRRTSSAILPTGMKDEPQLRRETAIQLYGKKSAGADGLWASVAQQYGGDRWELEALGIGATGAWDGRLAAYLKKVPNALSTKAGRDIIWRSRAAQTPELLAQIISDPKTPIDELPRYFRAFDFLTGEKKNAAIQQLAFNSTGGDDARQALIVTEAVNRVQGFDVSQQPDKLAALNKVLDRTKGTLAYLTLVDRFNLQDRYPEIVALAQDQPDSQLAVDAVKLLVNKEHRQLVTQGLRDDDPLRAAALARALGNATDNKTAPFLAPIVDDAKAPLAVRQEAVKSLGKSKAGARQLLDRVKSKKLADDLTQAAAFSLQTSPFDDFKSEVAAIFPSPPARNEQPLPPLGQLLKMKGDVNRGKVVYNTVGKCITCHVVNGEGKDVGPNHSEIGSKLSREAFFEAILFPSAGISHNYETWTAVTDSGNTITGILVSQTPTEVQLKGSDAIIRTVKRSELDEFVKQPVSLMPADLQKTMTVEELVDVIEYSQTLKKK